MPKVYTDEYGQRYYDYSDEQNSRPKDISNITDELVANLMYNNRALGGENTNLLMGSSGGNGPHINLYGDSISVKDGSKWRVHYMGYPQGSEYKHVYFTRDARQYDDNGKLIKSESRDFKYAYPNITDAEYQASKNGGIYHFSHKYGEKYDGFSAPYRWFNNRKKKSGGTINYLNIFN